MSILNEVTFTNKADTRNLVDEVVQDAFDAVTSTMGPNGQFALIIEMNLPKVTKDGVSVAKALDFNEARRNAIAKVITEPSIKTDMEVGDGTTTTVFMLGKFYQMFKDRMTFNNIRLIDSWVERTRQILNEMVIPGDVNSDVFRNMLMTTSNYETEIVDRILDIYRTYKNPNVVLQKVPSLGHDVVETNNLVYFHGQYGSDEFVPRGNEQGQKVCGHPDVNTRVVLIDGHVNRVDIPVLTQLVSDIVKEPGIEPQSMTFDGETVIIARNFDPSVITTFKQANAKFGCRITPYQLNVGGSLGSNVFRDLSELLKVNLVTEFSELLNQDHDYAGSPFILAPKAIYIEQDENGHIQTTCDNLVAELSKRYDMMTVIDRQTPVGKNLFDRISRLSGNNVVIKVTGTVPSEATERYYRYEDAMKAAKTGITFGILPGIGYGYLTAARRLVDEIANNPMEPEEFELFQDFIEVLLAQYKHLTEDSEYELFNEPSFLDLVTGEREVIPTKVFDNAAATMTALSGGWSTAKTLGKLSNVMGRSHQTYQ